LELASFQAGVPVLPQSERTAMLPRSQQFDAALRIVAELRAVGYEAYLAGGCVRDLLLGREPKDYDVATSATPQVVLEMFPRTFAVGARFGVVLVATGGTPQVVTEVATFRSDGAYTDGRHPDGVRYTASAEEDVRRRDFTVNGLLLDPEKLFPQGLKPTSLAGLNVLAEARALQNKEGTSADEQITDKLGFKSGLDFSRAVSAEKSTGPFGPEECFPDISMQNLRAAVIDYVGGVADLKARVVRAIGRPEMRFEEDHLRMLRGVRFAARLGFELETGTKLAMRALAVKTAAVSRERVRDELTKMLTEGHARRAFELLDETGLLAEVLPEVARMKGVEQPPQFHPEGDVWQHTLLVLGQLEEGCLPTLAWGALLHDVGKPPTFRLAERIRFDRHVEVGVAMAAEICRRFRFSNDETRQTLALVENHMRFADAQRMNASTLKRFFRLENFDEHLALHRMDCLASSGHLENWEFVRERLAAIPEEAVRPRPLLTGHELIAAGYKPGARFKEMLRAVEDGQLEGAIGTQAEALALILERFPLT
jgi:putative nucleotidyltransferase with HDIG domain